jgi:hypothetical protein
MAWTTFEGYMRFRTGKAFLFESYYWEGAIWFPVSQCIIEQDGEETWTIKVKDWLTKKNGIEEFTPYTEEDIARFNDF